MASGKLPTKKRKKPLACSLALAKIVEANFQRNHPFQILEWRESKFEILNWASFASRETGAQLAAAAAVAVAAPDEPSETQQAGSE